jgi:hypothetical protein
MALAHDPIADDGTHNRGEYAVGERGEASRIVDGMFRPAQARRPTPWTDHRFSGAINELGQLTRLRLGAAPVRGFLATPPPPRRRA